MIMFHIIQHNLKSDSFHPFQSKEFLDAMQMKSSMHWPSPVGRLGYLTETRNFSITLHPKRSVENNLTCEIYVSMHLCAIYNTLLQIICPSTFEKWQITFINFSIWA